MRCSHILETQAQRGISRLDRTPRVGIGKHQLAHGLRAGNEYPFANLQLVLFRNKGRMALAYSAAVRAPKAWSGCSLSKANVSACVLGKFQ